MDYEILRNGSGYVDPTAYKAIKKYQEGEQKMEYKRGEIYEYETNNGNVIKKALVVSADFRKNNRYISVILLTDEPKTDDSVRIVCNGIMYADCGMVSIATNDRLFGYFRTASDEEMAQIDEGIAKNLGIEQKTVEKLVKVPTQSTNNDAELMQAKAEAGIYKDLYEKLLAKVMG